MNKLLAILIVLLFPSLASAQSWSLSASGSVNAAAATTSISLNVSGVDAGDTVIACASAAGTVAVDSVNDGTGNLTNPLGPPSGNWNTGQHRGGQYYVLESVASGTVTYTANWSSAVTGRNLAVLAFTRTGTASFITSENKAENSSSLETDPITVTGDDILVTACADYASGTLNTEQIDGVAADGILEPASFTMWYKIFSADITGEGTAGISSQVWGASILGFEASAAAPGGDDDCSGLLLVDVGGQCTN